MSDGEEAKNLTYEQVDQEVNRLLLEMIDAIFKENKFEEALASKNATGLLPPAQAKHKATLELDAMKKALAEQFGCKKILFPLYEGLLKIADTFRALPKNDPVAENFFSALKKSSESQELAESKESTQAKEYENLQEYLGLTLETMQAMYQVGRQYYENKDYERAGGIFYFITECNPYIFEPWLYLGECLQQIDDHIGAVSAYVLAVANNPKSSHAFLRLGISQAKLGNLQDAQEALDFAEKNRAEWSELELQDYEELKQCI